MDFTGRSTQPQAAPSGNHAAAPVPPAAPTKRKQRKGSWNRAGVMVFVAAVIILIIALTIFIGFGGNSSKDEDKYVDTSKLQAVFLNTGQVYFGNIKTLNSKYFVLTNIYYLQTTGNGSSSSSTSTGSNNVTLVKLGCELHEPYDQMVINSSQVTFWENLQDNGQVATAVSKFQKENPNGLKCTDQSSSSSSTSTNATQNANTSNTSSGSSTTSSSSNSSTTAGH